MKTLAKFLVLKTKSRTVVGAADPDAGVTYVSDGDGKAVYREFPLRDVVNADGTVRRRLTDAEGRRWEFERMCDWVLVRVAETEKKMKFKSKSCNKTACFPLCR